MLLPVHLHNENSEKIVFILVFFPADEHNSHQELVRGVTGQRTAEANPIHGETHCSSKSICL